MYIICGIYKWTCVVTFFRFHFRFNFISRWKSRAYDSSTADSSTVKFLSTRISWFWCYGNFWEATLRKKSQTNWRLIRENLFHALEKIYERAYTRLKLHSRVIRRFPDFSPFFSNMDHSTTATVPFHLTEHFCRNARANLASTRATNSSRWETNVTRWHVTKINRVETKRNKQERNLPSMLWEITNSSRDIETKQRNEEDWERKKKKNIDRDKTDLSSDIQMYSFSNFSQIF